MKRPSACGASGLPDWNKLNREITACELCPRLRDYCRSVAREKRRAFQNWEYWGRPVPNFGDSRARLLIVGLAPAAHGGNRTGRVFTGDRSGDWLFRALHKAGFANQATSVDRRDGLALGDCAITAICHCAPPGNKPALDEIANCRRWLEQTIDVLPVRVFLALGRLAWDGVVREARRRQWLRGAAPKFAHAAQVSLDDDRWLLGSFHPSQQNTFTGKLTEPMFDRVFAAARELIGAADITGFIGPAVQAALPRPPIKRYMRTVGFVLAVALVSSGCSIVSGFHRDWQCCSCAPHGDNLGGCWQGCWDSQCTGHQGNLKAIICRQDECHYEARFRGTFFKVIPFQYKMTLTAVRHDDHFDLHGQKDLGRMLGVYRFQGSATPTSFVARYTSQDDQGRFVMSRR